MDDIKIINKHGGPYRLAEKLGYPQPQGSKRVFNWVKRGIPASVKLERPDLFLPKGRR